LRSISGRGQRSSLSRCRRSNRKKTSAAALPLSDASWIMPNEVMPSGAHAAEFAVEIGLPGADRCDGRGDRRIFVCPIETGAGDQPYAAAIEARVHAIAVELDFVEPAGPIRRCVDKLRELRLDPLRQSGRIGGPPMRYRSWHTGSGERLRCRRRMRLWIPRYPSATARRAPTVRAAS
jgi:hypothetical protein